MIDSSPGLRRLTIDSNLIQHITKSDGINGIKINHYQKVPADLSDHFDALKTLILGKDCIEDLYKLNDILTSFKKSIVKFSLVSAFSPPYTVNIHSLL